MCGIGMKNFVETKDDAKLWVPKSSRVLPEKEWKDKMFPEETRFTTMIVTAPNMLTPWMINAVRSYCHKDLGTVVQRIISLIKSLVNVL